MLFRGVIKITICHSLFAPFCSKAVESLAEGSSSEVRRVKEDAQKKVQQVEDLLTKRIVLLEEVSLETLWRMCFFQWVNNGVGTIVFFPHKLPQTREPSSSNVSGVPAPSETLSIKNLYPFTQQTGHCFIPIHEDTEIWREILTRVQSCL